MNPKDLKKLKNCVEPDSVLNVSRRRCLFREMVPTPNTIVTTQLYPKHDQSVPVDDILCLEISTSEKTFKPKQI
jgi:hypothetical protein